MTFPLRKPSRKIIYKLFHIIWEGSQEIGNSVCPAKVRRVLWQ